MSKRPRRNHTTFKAKVALAAVKGEKTLADWRSSSTSTPSDHPVESPAPRRRGRGVRPGKSEAAAPGVDLKSLHAKIGELTLENGLSQTGSPPAGWGGSSSLTIPEVHPPTLPFVSRQAHEGKIDGRS